MDHGQRKKGNHHHSVTNLPTIFNVGSVMYDCMALTGYLNLT